MRPWEETWYARNRTSCCTDVMVQGDERECAFYGTVPCGDPKFEQADARAKLAAAAPEMARMLIDLEWSGTRHAAEDPACPWCHALADREEHDAGCKLRLLLAKIGALPT